MQTQTSHRASPDEDHFRFDYSRSLPSTLFLSHRGGENYRANLCIKIPLKRGESAWALLLLGIGRELHRSHRREEKLQVSSCKIYAAKFLWWFNQYGKKKIPLWAPYYLFRQIKGLFHLASNTVGVISDHKQYWWMSSENSFPGKAGLVLSGALDSAPHPSQHTPLPQGNRRQPIHRRDRVPQTLPCWWEEQNKNPQLHWHFAVLDGFPLS